MDAIGRDCENRPSRAGVIERDRWIWRPFFAQSCKPVIGRFWSARPMGVGTKLKIASMLDKHDTVGIDLVAMCVNDIIVQAQSRFFFSRLSFDGKSRQSRATVISLQIARGCKQAQCALLGGETAEMPGFLRSTNEYDLAGSRSALSTTAKLSTGPGYGWGINSSASPPAAFTATGIPWSAKVCF